MNPKVKRLYILCVAKKVNRVFKLLFLQLSSPLKKEKK